MRRYNARLAAFPAFVSLLVAILMPLPAYAEVGQSGISVTPAQLAFSVQAKSPEQTSQEVMIANSYDTAVRLTAELQAIDESSVRLVPAGPLDETVAKAIKLSATDITVPARGSFRLRVAIDGTLLSGGGHYATLVLTQNSATDSPSDFRSAIAVNLFVVKNENIHTNLRLVDASIGHTLFSLPTSGSLTFRNLGNTHVVPRASISIYENEDLVSKAVLNQNSVPLFPNQQATTTAKFETYKHFVLPKKLRAHITYRIDGSDIQLTKDQTFWYVPLLDAVVLAVLGGLLWLSRHQIRRMLQKMKRHRRGPKKPMTRHRASPSTSVATTARVARAEPAKKSIPIKITEDDTPRENSASKNG